MDYEELLGLAHRHAGRRLETVSGRAFTVGVYRDCAFFTPESTGRGQSDGRKAAERFVARYNETGSLRPGDYADVTRNASYYVGLIRAARREPAVRQLRLVVTALDFDEALHFYRDVLGLPEAFAVSSPGGRVAILEAGRATLELADPAHAAYIDEVEVGRRVAGQIRVALEVEDANEMTERLADAGAHIVARPVPTPWGSLNSRLDAPAGLQLTIFAGEEYVE